MSASAVPWPDTGSDRLEDRLSIEPDGTIRVRSGKVEYGQGIRTGFAQMVAQELCVPLDRVRVQLGETDTAPWDMGTFGSLSTATEGLKLRAAAAYARACLLERASAFLAVSASGLRLQDGHILAPDGRAVSYERLTASAALSGPIPSPRMAPDARAERERLIGSLPDHKGPAPARLEGLDIVLGRPRFACDVRLPGMLRGRVLRAPYPGAKLESLEESALGPLGSRIRLVRDGDFVGVVSEREELVDAAVRALLPRWRREVPPIPRSSIEIRLRSDEDVKQALDDAPFHLRAEYHIPHIAHAAIAPSAAVADVRPREVDLYVATQRPFGLRDEVASLLKLPTQSVHVHPQAMGGMFGRGNMNDAAIEAAHLSKSVGRPVLVQWSRSEEFRLSPHRPCLDAQIEASLDEDGRIRGWRYLSQTNPHTYGSDNASDELLASTCGRNAIPPYRIARADVRVQVVPGAVRTGALRSLAAAPNVFAIESFMDELSHAGGWDPVAFRLRHVDDPRLRRVIEAVCDRSRWDSRACGAGEGFGMACAIYHGTYIAQVARVQVPANRTPRLERVWCAVDPGEVIWEDGARNQIEGAIQQAASWTLLERLDYSESGVTTATWRDYPIATALDAPAAIEVVFLPFPGATVSGLGEPGAVPLGAALANAIFDATGVRHRFLPIAPPDVRLSPK